MRTGFLGAGVLIAGFLGTRGYVLGVGDFATCPQPFGLSPGAAISPPAPGVWPPAPDSPVVGDGGSPETVPSFWGQPPKISAPTKNSLCVLGGGLETLLRTI